MTEPIPQIEIAADQLNRGLFIKSLVTHIDTIANMDLKQLPAPRVIAVDAAWGQGKSWLAATLKNHLDARSADAKTVLIDAFRFDHHNDAFAVIAAALMKELRPNEERKRSYLNAAGHVLKSAAPALVKGVAAFGVNLIGLNGDAVSEGIKAATDAVVDSAADFSEEAVERVFKSYSATQTIHENFVAALGNITADEKQPVVVIIDELDRCRPSFALEILERIKHLFVAPNVVFALFWNSSALHESIRHTYGQGTNAEAYLAKFVALEIPISITPIHTAGSNLRYMNFLSNNSIIKSAQGAGLHFAERLAEVSEFLNPTLRDVEMASLLYSQCLGKDFYDSTVLAYLLLLKITDKKTFYRLSRSDAQAFKVEAQRFRSLNGRPLPHEISTLHAHLQILGNEDYYFTAKEKARSQEISAYDKQVLSLTSDGKDSRVIQAGIIHIDSRLLSRQK